jgi:hypothetical protein
VLAPGRQSASSQSSASGFGRVAGERPRREAALGRGLDRREDVRAAPRRAQRDEDVAGPAVRANLAGEGLLEAVVVRDRREARGVACRQSALSGAALGLEAPDELGRQVLGLRGAAAVADGEQPPVREQRRGEAAAPALELVAASSSAPSAPAQRCAGGARAESREAQPPARRGRRGDRPA